MENKMGIKSFPTSKRKQKLQVKSKQDTIQYHYTDDLFKLNILNNSGQFVTCQCFINQNIETTSPAHWHKEIEILHVLEGSGFVHICQSQKITFNAPAILVVPSNLIHRTFYPANCKVNRTLFSSDYLRFQESDEALDDCLSLLTNGELLHSIIIEQDSVGFKKFSAILDILESLSNANHLNVYDPVNAHNVASTKEPDDAYAVASALHKIQVNEGKEQDNTEAFKTLERIEAEQNSLSAAQLLRDKAVNAGSIAIASAQNFDSFNHGGSVNKDDAISEAYVQNIKLSGLMIQFKALLLNIIGCLLEYGYIVKFDTIRKPRISNTNDEKIRSLLTYIHENYNTQIKISNLAERLNVTNQYFCRFFKLLTDMSFIDYINDLRIQMATRDIISTELPIRTISVKHGFESVGYFFKLFKARYNTTPTKYRIDHKSLN